MPPSKPTAPRRATLDAQLTGEDTVVETTDSDVVAAAVLAADGDKDLDFGSIPSESPAEDDAVAKDAEDPFAKISELMMSTAPEPIPDVFATTPPKPASRRKGAAGLWLLVVALLIAGVGAGLYFLQDKVIDQVPEAAKYYEQLGIRNEVIGAGLTFRNYNSERLVQDANEVLIVRGVIANTTDQPREIPLLRLALYNNQSLLQEKIISPPQANLDARGTVGFRITLDQPDASASRFEVTFAAAKPPVPEPPANK
ncbi:DUF3426 domain-containing protein [Telmatospirillum sp.]|uniref:DUF3426 domain-containing protein n=1 Tax=Telmatospirillum sp. TaxID=2079197 RepID=UPI00284B5B55|nr:DUF3426 domain-containing protein [Telmatospirillum sp.]MDR3441161.1 DUF3426 domain-containing protein [Telmatospirillum sp.]